MRGKEFGITVLLWKQLGCVGYAVRRSRARSCMRLLEKLVAWNEDIQELKSLWQKKLG